MEQGGMMLKFDPEEAMKRLEEKIGRPLTEKEKTNCEVFMQVMLSMGIKAGEVFILPETDTRELGG